MGQSPSKADRPRSCVRTISFASSISVSDPGRPDGSASIFDKSERADGALSRSELDGSYSDAGLNPSTSVQMAASSVSACRAVWGAKRVRGSADVQEDCEDTPHGIQAR